MDEFSTEQEQIEELRKWWDENKRYVVTGLVLGLAILFGYRAWVDMRNTRAEGASLQYSLLQDAIDGSDAASAEAILATLSRDYAATPYLDQAYLAMARLRAESGDLDGAAEMLEAALGSRDKELARIARLRLARVRLAQGELDAALEYVSNQDAGSYTGLYAELRGDIHLAAGRSAEAATTYRAALDVEGDGLMNRALVEMKLAELGQPEFAANGQEN